MVSDAVATTPLESVTFTEKVSVCELPLGVPLITPDGLSASLEGSEPDASDHT